MHKANAAFETARLVARKAPKALELVGAYVAVVQSNQVGTLIGDLRTTLPLGSLQHLRRVKRNPALKQQQDAQTEVLLCALSDLKQRRQQGQGQQQQLSGQLQQQQQQQDTQLQDQQQQQQPYPTGLPDSTTAVLASCQAAVEVRQVPACAADTRAHWLEWSKYWPMPFHGPSGSNTSAAKQQDGDPPSTDDQAYFEQHMAAVLAASSAAGGVNVARIVDPKTGEVIGQAVDASSRHPLDHAAMCAIEAAAARDRRLWPFNGFTHLGRNAPDSEGYEATPTVHPACTASETAENGAAAAGAAAAGAAAAGAAGPGVVQGQVVAGITEQLQRQLSPSLPPASKKHKSNGSTSSCNGGTSCSNGQQQEAQQGPSNGSAATAGAAAAAAAGTAAAAAEEATAGGSNGSVDWSKKPYLCTGYDCFLLREPCSMCSMALVHSRVARVVYCQQDPQHGALGGARRLHAQSSLNHHYLVYHLPLKGQQQQ